MKNSSPPFQQVDFRLDAQKEATRRKRHCAVLQAWTGHWVNQLRLRGRRAYTYRLLTPVLFFYSIILFYFFLLFTFLHTPLCPHKPIVSDIFLHENISFVFFNFFWAIQLSNINFIRVPLSHAYFSIYHGICFFLFL